MRPRVVTNAFDSGTTGAAAAITYKGFDETSKKWASFDLDHPHPLRLGTLIYLVQQAGHDAQAILAEAEPQFSVVADEGGDQ